MSNLSFSRLAGVVTLANAIEYARMRGCQVVFSDCQPSRPAIAYLDDSGFFERYAGTPIRQHAQLRDTTAPFQCVSYADNRHWLEAQFGYWLAGRLNVTPPGVASITACMKEAFNNIDDHSTLQIGCTHMQHFPNESQVVIAIADFGVGIPATIRRVCPGLDDATAIERASQPGMTSRTTRGNRGVGLGLLIDVVVNMNRGSVSIHSGNGALSCKLRDERQTREPSPTRAFYPGTMLGIRLDANTFEPDDGVEEDLQW